MPSPAPNLELKRRYLVAVGAVDEIGLATEKMPPQPDAQGRLYVPASPKVLQATKMLNPNDTLRLRFNAPSEPGDYPYLCTYPGHWQRMRGVLKVVKDLDEYLAQGHAEPAAPVITEWKLADLEAELPKLARGRDFAKGKALFTSVGCIACHAPPGLNGAPPMGDVAAWAPRIAKGMDTLHQHALMGFQGEKGLMPQKGGRVDLSDAEIIGVDVGAPVLRYAHARAEAFGLPIHFSQQNGEETNFPDGFFDVVCSHIIMHETSTRAAPRIFSRVM